MKRNGAQVTRADLLNKIYDDDATAPWVSYGIGFDQDADDRLSFSTGHAGGVHNTLATVGSIPDGVWTHVVATYDPAASAPQKKIYVDGVLNTSSTLTSAVLYDTTNRGDLYLGGITGYFHDGTLDDVRIYNRALTADEVLTLNNHGIGCAN